MTSFVGLYRDINLLLDMIEAKLEQCKELYKEKIATVHNNTVGINASESKEPEAKKAREIVRCSNQPFGNYLIFD